jgi:hypothetical protein
MPLAAATATPHAPAAGLLLLALLAVTVGYVLACWLWPFTACRRCDGHGRRRAPFGRAFRLCRRCDGAGRRLRLGRRAYNATRRINASGR